MKKFAIPILILLNTVLSVGCKKGDTGPAGPQGPQGVAGNANVTLYTFGAHNFATNSTASLQVTTTQDTMTNSAWFVYLVRASGNVYPIPGFGLGGSSDYRVYWNYSGGKVNFTISRVSGTGEEYLNIKIIRAYANTLSAAARVAPLPAIDFRDYHAVCKYYNLPY